MSNLKAMWFVYIIQVLDIVSYHCNCWQ